MPRRPAPGYSKDKGLHGILMPHSIAVAILVREYHYMRMRGFGFCQSSRVEIASDLNIVGTEPYGAFTRRQSFLMAKMIHRLITCPAMPLSRVIDLFLHVWDEFPEMLWVRVFLRYQRMLRRGIDVPDCFQHESPEKYVDEFQCRFLADCYPHWTFKNASQFIKSQTELMHSRDPRSMHGAELSKRLQDVYQTCKDGNMRPLFMLAYLNAIKFRDLNTSEAMLHETSDNIAGDSIKYALNIGQWMLRQPKHSIRAAVKNLVVWGFEFGGTTYYQIPLTEALEDALYCRDIPLLLILVTLAWERADQIRIETAGRLIFRLIEYGLGRLAIDRYLAILREKWVRYFRPVRVFEVLRWAEHLSLNALEADLTLMIRSDRMSWSCGLGKHGMADMYANVLLNTDCRDITRLKICWGPQVPTAACVKALRLYKQGRLHLAIAVLNWIKTRHAQVCRYDTVLELQHTWKSMQMFIHYHEFLKRGQWIQAIECARYLQVYKPLQGLVLEAEATVYAGFPEEAYSLGQTILDAACRPSRCTEKEFRITACEAASVTAEARLIRAFVCFLVENPERGLKDLSVAMHLCRKYRFVNLGWNAVILCASYQAIMGLPAKSLATITSIKTRIYQLGDHLLTGRYELAKAKIIGRLIVNGHLEESVYLPVCEDAASRSVKMFKQTGDRVREHHACHLKRVLVIAHHDVDAVCATQILLTLFRCDEIMHSMVTIQTVDECRNTFKEFKGKVKYAVLINCGASIDVTDVLEDDEIIVFVADHHRPIDVANFHSISQINLLCRLDVEREEIADIPDYDAIYRKDSSDEEPDEDEEDDPENERGRKRQRLNEDIVLRRAKRRQWEDERRRILLDYNEFSYYGPSTAIMMFELAWKMTKDSNDLLWWAVVGMSEMLVNGKIRRDTYALELTRMQPHVLRLNPRLPVASGDGNTLRRNTARGMHIAIAEELNLPLYQHWSLWDSMRNSRQVACRFKLWSTRGERGLLGFLAELGDNLNPVLEGINFAKHQLSSVFRLTQVLLDMQSISVLGSFLYVVVSDGCGDAKSLWCPPWLHMLAQFLLEANAAAQRHRKARTWPLVMALPDPQSIEHQFVVGIPPLAQDSPKNLFGRAFEHAISRTEVEAEQNSFDTSIIRIRKTDVTRFVDALATLLESA
ncbi:unnamed protein product [Notodromas monacha]|uniref:Cell division control protein 45 n=1 Tax=Notodromas monacha TaxID=399045 RepID=A0A7R9BBX3_9CRUS|nr:unnamed protein product [Notodromas monacha]CAG0912461.1 unnamed protein product [Notodromas monacha]